MNRYSRLELDHLCRGKAPSTSGVDDDFPSHHFITQVTMPEEDTVLPTEHGDTLKLRHNTYSFSSADAALRTEHLGYGDIASDPEICPPIKHLSGQKTKEFTREGESLYHIPGSHRRSCYETSMERNKRSRFAKAVLTWNARFGACPRVAINYNAPAARFQGKILIQSCLLGVPCFTAQRVYQDPSRAFPCGR